MNFSIKRLNNLFKIGMIACLVLISFSTYAQLQTADKIIAIVGRNKIILQSELDQQTLEAKNADPTFNDTNKCLILQNMIMQKLLVEQAERDSVIVSDEDIEANLDNRIRQWTMRYGGKEKVEEAAGKTIYQLKEDSRDVIKDMMTAEKERSTILENVKITPAEVAAFYNKYLVDSLPFFPAAVEIGQIVIDPPTTPEMDDYARKTLAGIRKRIVEGGESFETMASLYSEDPGSKDNGGRYNDVPRTGGGWAPEFITGAFKLQNGEVSQIIKTKFGYHIIQMVQRKGDEADIRHILIRPQHTTGDFKVALEKLDSIRSLLIAGKIGFSEAVGKYSTDDQSKMTGGMISDPHDGKTDLAINTLDPSIVLTLDSMKVGSYSQPQIFVTDAHEKTCRIVYLKSRSAPHKANLKDDYSKIEDLALSEKKIEKLEAWIEEKLPTYYLKIDPQYATCNAFKSWNIVSK